MDRYHKAARDGYLDALKEATRKDLNTKDEDGMTPTLWASFEGNLDALRLIVGRGGDPDKCDNFGNTALHFGSARGHMNCVSFLVNFGMNMWALDIDFHTAKDLAAINNRGDILRFLDTAISKEETKDSKKAKSYREKSMKDAEKRVKEFDKLQEKARKVMEEEQKKLMKHRKEMEKQGTVKGMPVTGGPPNLHDHRPSMAFLSLRKDSRLLYGQSPKFSEIVANSQHHSGSGSSALSKVTSSGVYKKVQQKKGQTMSGTRPPPRQADSEFKIREIEDGKRSVRSLSGLRRDSEIMYVPKYDLTSNNAGKRGKISGLFNDDDDDDDDQDIDYGRTNDIDPDSMSYATSRSGGTVGKRAGSISGIGMTRSISQPDYMHQVGTDSGFTDDTALPHNIPSIFERPGFGSVAFRNSITSTLATFPNFSQNGQSNGGSSVSGTSSRKHRDSIDSSGSPNEPHADYPSDEDEDRDFGAVAVFLAAAGLRDYISEFEREKIDLEALMLLTDEDFKAMGIEMGPRRKLLKAINDRQAALESPGEVIDNRL